MAALDEGEMQDAARAAIDGLGAVLGKLGLQYVEAPEHPFGIGIGAAWSANDFTVLSVAFGDPGMVNLASAVSRDVRQDDRAGILDITNRLTRDNPMRPCVLHDADAGWDVLAMMRFPATLLIAREKFFNTCVTTLPQFAAAVVPEFAAFGGRRPEWTAEDLHELVTRSML